MAMVRRGVIFSLRDASCCMVEVVNGGAGERFLSVRFTDLTAKAALRSSSMMACTSACVCGSYFLPFCP